jgi:phosphoribosylformimino-5-aminoimidazole carboxamide ribotide isomerase
MIDIIPAIDIMDGRCVRLVQGDYTTQKVYSEDPVKIARMFEDSGCKYLHLVDLDGALSGKMTNVNILKSITENTSLIIDYSGGIRTSDDVDLAFRRGAKMVCIGSMSYKQPEIVYEWEKYTDMTN